MIRKKSVILSAYREKNTRFLDILTILGALENRGFKMTKKGLSNFVRNNLEYKYLISSKDTKGTIVGWELVGSY
ncbi:MAG: hypothetical protein V3R82_00555 [Candidatus Hydrothermarchaeales archaeon]